MLETIPSSTAADLGGGGGGKGGANAWPIMYFVHESIKRLCIK